jgi:hypothetical protein
LRALGASEYPEPRRGTGYSEFNGSVSLP